MSLGASMTAANLSNGGSLTFTVPTNVTLGTSGSVSLNATVNGTNDPQANNNAGSATAMVYSADVSVSSSAPSGAVAGGGVANFGVVVSNAGPDTARDVALAITPGAGLTAGALTCTASGGAVCPSALSSNLTIPTLPKGGALTIGVPATVTAGTNGTVSLQATATSAGDPSSANNATSASATAYSANVSVSNTTSANVGSGGTAFFQATVANSGPATSQNVVITTTVSSGYSVGTMTCAAAGGAVCPGSVSTSTTVPTLPVGGSLVLTIPVPIPAGASGPLTTTVTVAAAGDPVGSNDTAAASTVIYSADVSVSSSAPSGAVAGGGVANFGVVVSNAGPDTARDVALAITPGAGLTAGALTCTASGGAVCPSALSSNLTIPTLPKGGALTIGVPATVTAGTNGTVSLQATATSAGDPSSANNATSASATAYSANVSVSNTTSANVGSGGTAFFQATVANSGPATSQNVVITTTVSSGYSVGTMTCAAAGGAVCPGSVSTSTTVPTLPVGGSLVLTIPVPIPAGASGPLTTTVTVAAAGDPVGSNNTSAATTTAVAADARNGTYYVYATNGALYSLSIDFNARTYEMTGTSGGGTPKWTGGFTADASGGGFTIAGNARFRVQPDLIVGGFDFGSGVVSFVAARNFVTTEAELTGDFVYLGINPDSGTPSSRIFPGQLNGLQWRICSDFVIYTMPNCPAASIWTFVVSPTGVDGEWLGVDSVHSDTVRFRLAKSGSERIFLRTDVAPSNGVKRFRIGLPNIGGLAAGNYTGGGTRGEWVTISTSDTAYSATGTLSNGSSITESATLSTVSGLDGLRSGRRSPDGASVFVIRSNSIVAIVGAQSGPADGAIQIGIK